MIDLTLGIYVLASIVIGLSSVVFIALAIELADRLWDFLKDMWYYIQWGAS